MTFHMFLPFYYCIGIMMIFGTYHVVVASEVVVDGNDIVLCRCPDLHENVVLLNDINEDHIVDGIRVLSIHDPLCATTTTTTIHRDASSIIFHCPDNTNSEHRTIVEQRHLMGMMMSYGKGKVK